MVGKQALVVEIEVKERRKTWKTTHAYGGHQNDDPYQEQNAVQHCGVAAEAHRLEGLHGGQVEGEWVADAGVPSQ